MADYKEFPKSCDPNDFWGQVRRTINGKPITQDQIDMIVATIEQNLIFDPKDILFDIGCGNGALSVLFFNKISGLVGIDYSEYLISVAIKHFEKKPNYTFHLGDAFDFIQSASDKDRFTKALCYGVFSYFENEKAQEILKNLSQTFPNLEKVYIGNLPDKDRANMFYYKDIDYVPLLGDNETCIGIWRSKDEMRMLAESSGWDIEFIQMPTEFFASHYRYDALLRRK